MEMKVVSVTEVEKKKKGSDDNIIIHKLKLKGSTGEGAEGDNFDQVKMTLTIESENSALIKNYCPLDIFASRLLALKPVPVEDEEKEEE